MNYYETKPYRDHGNDPAISVYIMAQPANSNVQVLDKFTCIWCKRTVYELHGQIDRMINAPMVVQPPQVGIDILCKLCHARYRLIITAYQESTFIRGVGGIRVL